MKELQMDLARRTLAPDRLQRRGFLRLATLGGVGAAFMDAVPAATVDSSSRQHCDDLLLVQQAESEEVEDFSRACFVAMDQLDLDGWFSFFSDDVIGQDAILGDMTDLYGGPGPLPNCSLTPKSLYRAFSQNMFAKVGIPGRFMKYTYAAGSMQYGAAVDLHVMPGTFFNNGVDIVSYLTIRGGKIVRRNDYYDTAELAPEDIAFVHKNGIPRFSCLAGPAPGDVANASPEYLSFVRGFHRALSAGDVTRVLQFFDDDALLVHPLLFRGSGTYGPYNRGIQVRGLKALARFFGRVLSVLPDGRNSSLMHVAGGSAGGGYEWLGGGIYAHQGIARTGINGVTSLELRNRKISRLSVKFDTIQMTVEQRDAIRGALAGECLVAS